MDRVKCVTWKGKEINTLTFQSLSEEEQDSLQLECFECGRKAFYRRPNSRGAKAHFACKPHTGCDFASKKSSGDESEKETFMQQIIQTDKEVDFPVDDFNEDKGSINRAKAATHSEREGKEGTTRRFVIGPPNVIPMQLSLRKALECLEHDEFLSSERIFLTKGFDGNTYKRRPNELFRNFGQLSSDKPYAFYGSIRSSWLNKKPESLSIKVEGANCEIVVKETIADEILRRSNLTKTEARLLFGCELMVYGYHDASKKQIIVQQLPFLFIEPVLDEDKAGKKEALNQKFASLSQERGQAQGFKIKRIDQVASNISETEKVTVPYNQENITESPDYQKTVTEIGSINSLPETKSIHNVSQTFAKPENEKVTEDLAINENSFWTKVKKFFMG
ncbi:MAG: hypothetical protein EOP04_05205 [Proteobacteria bacterium]|nr:MAG: hypothetical protein EOP04_05205 [Pseudomonadota bacterium]